MTRPKATPPGERLLDALIDHIAYEVAAMEASADIFARRRVWLALDGFLLHARALRDFFFGQWNEDDRYAESSIFAENYLPLWRSIKGSLPKKTLDATEEPVDKQLAHITRERMTAYEQLEPAVEEMRKELMGLWDRFISELRGDRRRQLFLDALERKRREVKL